MSKVWCCRRFQDAEVYKISPTRSNIKEEIVLYRKACAFCNMPVLEILRSDIRENILKPVRLKTKNIKTFVENMSILFKLRKHYTRKQKISKFILGYNEFGKFKKCSDNFSGLKLGKTETDPLLNIRVYKQHKSHCSTG